MLSLILAASHAEAASIFPGEDSDKGKLDYQNNLAALRRAHRAEEWAISKIKDFAVGGVKYKPDTLERVLKSSLGGSR